MKKRKKKKKTHHGDTENTEQARRACRKRGRGKGERREGEGWFVARVFFPVFSFPFAWFLRVLRASVV